MSEILLKPAFEIELGKPVRQCRAVSVKLGADGNNAYLCAYSSDFDVDPYVEMFFFPEDTLHFMMISQKGEMIWQKDLGRGVIPGVWFCPVFAFDLNGDGVDEIWFVNNKNTVHPLGTASYTLTGLDSLTGEELYEMPWPHTEDFKRTACLSHQFRNFIVGGYVKGDPVLVTAQGTYGDMYFEGYGPGLQLLWEHKVLAQEPGARGSHMCPVIDLNGDGVDELLWGERCIELEHGTELFCCDRDTYHGHSDLIIPVTDQNGIPWRLFTCREQEEENGPRICCYDGKGTRVWGNLERGHIDLGWVARLGPSAEKYGLGVRIGHKTCGPEGRFHDSYEEFIYEMESGKEIKLDFSAYKSMPVDLNGDGYHELVYGLPAASGDVRDRFGTWICNIGGSVALSGKLLDKPGEQILVYGEDGYIRIWYDENAEDSNMAKMRYENPYYEKAMAVMGNGYNWCILGGI